MTVDSHDNDQQFLTLENLMASRLQILRKQHDTAVL